MLRSSSTKATHEARYSDFITVRNARVHNLRNITVSMPRNQLVVITGPSGSGKSSLAFDTIYAEGQRQYVESLSVYARQFIEQLSKPDVDSISGLSPAISIEQKTSVFNPRSTVGTVTEVYDYLRLLYARIAKPICYECKKPIQSQSPQQIVDLILSHPDDSRISLLAPVVRGRKGEYQRELIQLRQQGFVRVLIDGDVHDLSEDIKLERGKRHDISVYIDRLILRGDREQLAVRVGESVELALRLGEGQLLLERQEDGNKIVSTHSQKFACADCGISYPEPEPRLFSFNSPVGACQKCNGLGYLGDEEDDSADTDEEPVFEFVKHSICPACAGARLRKESIHFLIKDLSINTVCDKSISSMSALMDSLPLSPREQRVAGGVIKEIKDRVEFLTTVGVGYLTLGRPATSLSGGESQRIRLATQIGSALVDVIYVLDEPSIGLHPRDHRKLLQSLRHLRDLGNTILVVEHDQETIESADWVVDLGPGAGVRGGEVVASGQLAEVIATPTSLTGQYLKGALSIPLPQSRRQIENRPRIVLKGASKNNLQSVDAEFPLGCLICVTGVSGSGKSSLILETLYPLLLKHIYKVDVGVVEVLAVSGLDQIDKVIDIDQTPIGRTPRSNPATYTGLFSAIRDLYSQLPASRVRGFKPGHFSFNVEGGRCEKCEGAGVTRIEMHFLPDVYVKCDSCQGQRYNAETLEIRYKGKNIAEVLAMTVEEGLVFFEAVPFIKRRLQVICDVGMGYITLGQQATTLSGGESQRMKLSRELSKRGTGKTMYLLDEPSTGLHFDDIRKLLQILHLLVDQGNTVVIIEHNLDIIKTADYIIDLGPDGGDAGGRIITAGTPEEIAANRLSYTGVFLKSHLEIK